MGATAAVATGTVTVEPPRLAATPAAELDEKVGAFANASAEKPVRTGADVVWIGRRPRPDSVSRPPTAATKDMCPSSNRRTMPVGHKRLFRVTVDAIHPGTTVRYHYRGGSSLATVTAKDETHVTFVGAECDGTFTHEQVDYLVDDGRLQIVLDDESHD